MAGANRRAERHRQLLTQADDAMAPFRKAETVAETAFEILRTRAPLPDGTRFVRKASAAAAAPGDATQWYARVAVELPERSRKAWTAVLRERADGGFALDEFVESK
jgi:hypothetical protein